MNVQIKVETPEGTDIYTFDSTPVEKVVNPIVDTIKTMTKGVFRKDSYPKAK